MAEIYIPLRHYKLLTSLVQFKEQLIGGQTPMAYNKMVAYPSSKKHFEYVLPELKQAGQLKGRKESSKKKEKTSKKKQTSKMKKSNKKKKTNKKK